MRTELSRGLRLPIVVCGPNADSMPSTLRDAPGGTAFGGQDPAEALRALLTGAGVHKPSY